MLVLYFVRTVANEVSVGFASEYVAVTTKIVCTAFRKCDSETIGGGDHTHVSFTCVSGRQTRSHTYETCEKSEGVVVVLAPLRSLLLLC